MSIARTKTDSIRRSAYSLATGMCAAHLYGAGAAKPGFMPPDGTPAPAFIGYFCKGARSARLICGIPAFQSV
ncbi:MAG: hypothetical protein OXU61_01095 [Gammaproteobacteria bacterium]|nr:hypothetical protein [Gammaproteobacteria bacterium]